MACAAEPPEPELYLPASLLKVVDGDTIKVRLDSGPISIRLHGIDAPERRQARGSAATKALRSLLEGESLEIEPVEQSDGYGRMVAKVRVRGDDVNARMVESGYAWAYRRYLRRGPGDERYCQLEADARSAGRGVWGDPPQQWQPPWEFRARGEYAAGLRYASETAASCIAAIGGGSPVTAGVPLADAPPAAGDCLIKGNINARGERIYHVPGTRSYADTRIDEARGERWFCSTGEAEGAGWRAVRR